MNIKDWGLLLICLVVAACSSLKTNEQNQRKQAKKETEVRMALQEQKTTGEWLSDSSKLQYSIRILPMGEFTYNTVDGFKGQAREVLLKGTQEHARLRLKTQRTKKAVQKSRQDKALQTMQQRHSEKEQFRWRMPVWFWVGLLVFAFLFGAYRLIRWRFRNVGN